MGILSKISSVLGFVLMLVGYIQKVTGMEIDPFTWIGLGNACLLMGGLLFLREERKKWRLDFLEKKPEYKNYEYLWILYKLLAKGRFYLVPGNLPGENALEEWHAQIINTLANWRTGYKEYYLLNDKANLGHRVCQLEQTLDWIVG